MTMPFPNAEYKLRPEPAHVDKRGMITNVLEKLTEPIEHVSFITSKKGSVRGNHCHRKGYQYIFLIRGGFVSYSKWVGEDGSSGDVTVTEVLPGEVLVTPPWVAHRHVYTKQSWMIAAYTVERAFLENEDTFSFIFFR